MCAHARRRGGAGMERPCQGAPRPASHTLQQNAAHVLEAGSEFLHPVLLGNPSLKGAAGLGMSTGRSDMMSPTWGDSCPHSGARVWPSEGGLPSD